MSLHQALRIVEEFNKNPSTNTAQAVIDINIPRWRWLSWGREGRLESKKIDAAKTKALRWAAYQNKL